MPRLQDPARGFHSRPRLNRSSTNLLSHFAWNPPARTRSRPYSSTMLANEVTSTTRTVLLTALSTRSLYLSLRLARSYRSRRKSLYSWMLPQIWPW
jgi:hypothetical protein